jgi:hypothetical protein
MADVVLHPTTSALLLQDLQNELIKGNRPVVPLTGVGILQEKRAPVPLEALPAPITLLALRRLAMPDDIGFVAIGTVQHLGNHRSPHSILVCLFLYTYCMPLSYVIQPIVLSFASEEHPVWRGHRKKAKR